MHTIKIIRYSALCVTIVLCVISILLVNAIPDKGVVLNAYPISSKIYDKDGNLLYEIRGETKRTLVDLHDISPYLKNATLVAEDKDFYSHFGISITSTSRALFKNYKAQSYVQGGSTITQQLVKNIFLTKEKSLKRKVWEGLLSIRMESLFSKDEILTDYLNTIPYGRNAYGAEAAAQTYFGTSAKSLTLAQSAYLSALPKAPTYYSPDGEHKQDLHSRAQYILGELKSHNYISEDEYNTAVEEKVVFSEVKTVLAAPHFVEAVIDELEKKYSRQDLEKAGLQITTTLDPKLQSIAEKAIQNNAETNALRYNGHNAALVAIEPSSGSVLAFVGSKNYFGTSTPAGCVSGANCKFDPKTNIPLSLRQSGSSFKVYTYLTAFGPSFGYNPSSMVLDRTENFAGPGEEPYIPHNYDMRERGMLSIRRALAGSLNLPAVRTIKKVGVDNVAKTARDVGITTPLQNCGYALTLGACEVTLLDHTAGFATIANMGKKSEEHTIHTIKDREGKVVYHFEKNDMQVADPQAVYELISILTDNRSRQYIFGNSSKNLVLSDRPVGAKTGTSQHFRDGWTMGFSTDIAAGVWVGNNDSTYMNYGADGVLTAGPIWHQFMEQAHKDIAPKTFQAPEGIVTKSVFSYLGTQTFSNMEVFASYATSTKAVDTGSWYAFPEVLSPKGLLMDPRFLTPKLPVLVSENR